MAAPAPTPASVPAGRPRFALIVEVDGSREEVAAAAAGAARTARGRRRGRSTRPPRRAAVALARRHQRRRRRRAAARRSPRTSCSPLERLEAGLEPFEEIAARHGLRSCAWGHGGDGNVHANRARRPRQRRRADAAAERPARSCSPDVVALGGSIAGEHGVGWLKRGRCASSGPKAQSSCTSRSSSSSTPRTC